MTLLHVPFCLEALESRRLLSATWTGGAGLNLPTPMDPTVEDWFADEGSTQIIGMDQYTPLALKSGHVEQTLATFAAPLKASDYIATVDWNDGTTSPGLIIDNHDGTYSVVGSHDYAETEATMFEVAVEIDGSDGSRTYSTWEVFANFDTLTFLTSIEEARAINPQDASDGLYELGWMHDMSAVRGDASAYLITVSWGDGTQSLGTASTDDMAGYAYDLRGSHQYDHTGLYDVTVTVTRPAIAGEASAPIVVDHGQIEVITWDEFLARDRATSIKHPNAWAGQVAVPYIEIEAVSSRQAAPLPSAPVAVCSLFASTHAQTISSQIFADNSAMSEREDFSLEF